MGVARAYLSSAYGGCACLLGLGIAYRWTQVASDVMADYVSAQTYAMRLSGEAHIGFAWNPLELDEPLRGRLRRRHFGRPRAARRVDRRDGRRRSQRRL